MRVNRNPSLRQYCAAETGILITRDGDRAISSPCTRGIGFSFPTAFRPLKILKRFVKRQWDVVFD